MCSGGAVPHIFPHLHHFFQDYLQHGVLICGAKPVLSRQHSCRQPKTTSLSEALQSGFGLVSALLSDGLILPIVIKTTQEYMSHDFK